jgi:hypothetical protein
MDPEEETSMPDWMAAFIEPNQAIPMGYDMTATLLGSIQEISYVLFNSGEEGRRIQPFVLNGEFFNIFQALSKVKDVNSVQFTPDSPFDMMTFLEFCVYIGDWKMACFFFANGASPASNQFNGVVQTQASSNGFGPPQTLPGFSHLNGDTTIPGFTGLRAIVEPDDENADEMLAYLWLMEICWAGYELDLPEEFSRILTCLAVVCPEHGIGARLQENLRTTSLVCVRKGLSSEQTLKILEMVVTSTIWSFFTEQIVSECIREEENRPILNEEEGAPHST